MEKFILLENERQILKRLVGQRLISFEAYMPLRKDLFGNFRINTNDKSIEIDCEDQNNEYVEMVAALKVIEVDKNKKYKSEFPNEEGTIIPLEGVIESVLIVEDEIIVKDNEYSTIMDQAIIFKTSELQYIFSRPMDNLAVFNYSVNKEFDDIMPTKDIQQNWTFEGDDPNDIVVKRTKIEL